MIELIEQHWQDFITLAGAHAIAVASPGPDFAVVTKNSVSYGKKVGRMTAFGVGVAILLHVTYALLGFSVLVKSNDTLYTAIKWIGAAFLLYLGIMSLRTKSQDFSSKDTVTTKTISMSKAFTVGFLTNALNVKALLFFLFLFTSIVNENSSLGTKLFYGAWLSGYTFLWFYFIASVFGLQYVRDFFTRFGVWFDRIMGIILIGLAIWLLAK